MLKDELKNLDCSQKKLREFGLLVGGVLAGFALLFWWRQKSYFPAVAAVSGALIFFGAAWPAALKPLYRAWMTLAMLLGWVMTRVLLTLLYFLTFTPIAFILKLTGKDFMSRKIERDKASYWIPKPSLLDMQPADFEKQF